MSVVNTWCTGILCRATWSTQSLATAMAAVIDKRLGLRAAARAYGIPPTTLKDHLDGKYEHAMGDTKHLGRPSILPPAIEKELVDHIIKCERMFFGLTRKDVMSLAYEIASRNGIQHIFNEDKKSSEPAGSSSEEAGPPSEPPRPSAEPVEPPL